MDFIDFLFYFILEEICYICLGLNVNVKCLLCCICLCDKCLKDFFYFLLYNLVNIIKECFEYEY